MLSIVRLSPRYQLTLPQEVRQALGCEVSDRIAFRSDVSGRIYIENMKAIDIASVRGLLRAEENMLTDGHDLVRTEDLSQNHSLLKGDSSK
ncbi:type II toxin-antitoxin system PrlF family antitoxin [Alicyclobacillus sp. SP_1]|uniref:AbrB/MazE/SpoVT family DNA-binding domain-containing protein n=1 Tax=Alicyclobacillus sp. SP_1 TaxID=2942475 RepID=UPI0021571146|nr:type II toxin-antitoxin system PrlF family antitoxin [Alicyclobacillus sp. SP_1]